MAFMNGIGIVFDLVFVRGSISQYAVTWFNAKIAREKQRGR